MSRFKTYLQGVIDGSWEGMDPNHLAHIWHAFRYNELVEVVRVAMSQMPGRPLDEAAFDIKIGDVVVPMVCGVHLKDVKSAGRFFRERKLVQFVLEMEVDVEDEVSDNDAYKIAAAVDNILNGVYQTVPEVGSLSVVSVRTTYEAVVDVPTEGAKTKL